MKVNSSVTIYHKDGLDIATHFEKWKRYNYDKAWFFGGKGAGTNKGYENANDFDCRIPYDMNDNLSIDNLAIGDIVVQGTLTTDINTQKDLKDYLIYNITNITDNNFGKAKHIHIGGK